MLASTEIIARLLLGTLLGGLIGFERQRHGRPAGFRTQLLVCVACVLLMIISENYYAYGTIEGSLTKLDPTRIAAGAMTGVGFLGAGVIVKTGMSVQGLTTAACIWIVAAIGLAVGTGQYLAAVTGSVITLISLWVLRIVELKIPRLSFRYIRMVTDESGDESRIRSFFEDKGFEISRMDYEISYPDREKRFIFTISSRDLISMSKITDEISSITAIKKIEIKS